MKTKEKADALVDEYFGEISHAITCIEHTIQVLEDVRDDISDDWYKANVNVAINEQTKLLTELKSRYE